MWKREKIMKMREANQRSLENQTDGLVRAELFKQFRLFIPMNSTMSLREIQRLQLAGSSSTVFAVNYSFITAKNSLLSNCEERGETAVFKRQNTGNNLDKLKAWGTYTYSDPLPDQYLTHAQRHITRAVAVMDSCFALIEARQRDIAKGRTRVLETF